MLESMPSLRRATRFLEAMLATITQGAACTVFYPAIPAAPSFQVHVEDRGRPVSGLRMELKGRSLTKTAVTGEDGTVRFQDIPPADYHVEAEFDAGIRDGATIQVTASGPKNTTIPIRWPNQAPLIVQAPKGVLHWHMTETDQRQSVLQVDLVDARTGKLQESTQTTSEGEFVLKTPQPGLYFLRVTPKSLTPAGGGRVAGKVPIRVASHAAQVDLELDFGWSSCGVTYVALHACPQEELSIAHLSGEVVDPTGASIARATVRLFNSDRTIAEQLTSDEEGRFVSAKPLDGSYELTVSATGFTSLRQMVRGFVPKDGVRPASLRIRLGLGYCSLATAQQQAKSSGEDGAVGKKCAHHFERGAPYVERRVTCLANP